MQSPGAVIKNLGAIVQVPFFVIRVTCTRIPLSQSQFPGVDEAELKAMDRQITELKEQLKGRQAKCHGPPP